MKTTYLILTLALVAWTGWGFDKEEAQAQLHSFQRGFDAENLTANAARGELRWFVDRGEKGRDFVKDYFNDSRNVPGRKAALYIYCKGWPTTCESRLRKAEEDAQLCEYARRLRRYLSEEREVSAPSLAELLTRAPRDRQELMDALLPGLRHRDPQLVAVALRVAELYPVQAFEKSDWPLAVARVAAHQPVDGLLGASLVRHLQLQQARIGEADRREIELVILKRAIFVTGTVPPPPTPPGLGGEVTVPGSADLAAKVLKDAEADPLKLAGVLGSLSRRGDVYMLGAVAPYLNHADEKVGEAALDCFKLLGAVLKPETRSPKRCFIWWSTTGENEFAKLKK